MSKNVLMTKDTTIQKVGGSMMVIVPSVIVELLAGLNGEPFDKDKKFTATIEINSEGEILVTKIKERKTNVGQGK